MISTICTNSYKAAPSVKVQKRDIPSAVLITMFCHVFQLLAKLLAFLLPSLSAKVRSKNSKIRGIAPFALHLPSCVCNCNILQPSFSACGVFQFDNYTMEAGWSRNYYASGWTQWGNWEGEPPWLNATKPPQKWQIMHVSSCINFWLLCIFCS